MTLVSASAPATPTARPIEHHQGGVSQHVRQHVAGPRAERHADADLAPTLIHRVREHAVEAQRREQCRDRRRTPR